MLIISDKVSFVDMLKFNKIMNECTDLFTPIRTFTDINKECCSLAKGEIIVSDKYIPSLAYLSKRFIKFSFTIPNNKKDAILSREELTKYLNNAIVFIPVDIHGHRFEIMERDKLKELVITYTHQIIDHWADSEFMMEKYRASMKTHVKEGMNGFMKNEIEKCFICSEYVSIPGYTYNIYERCLHWMNEIARYKSEYGVFQRVWNNRLITPMYRLQ